MIKRVERIARKVLGDNAGIMTDALTWAGTYHGIGARLLREYADDSRGQGYAQAEAGRMADDQPATAAGAAQAQDPSPSHVGQRVVTDAQRL
jgi:superfamily I DNA/RNA helicase